MPHPNPATRPIQSYDRVRNVLTGAVGIVMPEPAPAGQRYVRWQSGTGSMTLAQTANLSRVKA